MYVLLFMVFLKFRLTFAKIKTKQLSLLFPGINNWEEVSRPAGEADVLIGLDYP